MPLAHKIENQRSVPLGRYTAQHCFPSTQMLELSVIQIAFPFFKHLVSSSRPTATRTPQAIQDMNNLKRFVRQAEMSHYALFRCCLFLQGCGNGDVLLQNARAEHSDLPEACSIIGVLEEFLREQSQARAQA